MNAPTKQDPVHRYVWVIQGLVWGALMFIIMGIVFPLADGQPFTARSIGFDLMLWSLAGLLFGWTDKKLTAWSLAREHRKQAGKKD